MRRLSGRINQRTSLCLQSFMALYCLCSGGESERKSTLCSTGEKCELASLREPDSIYRTVQDGSLCRYCQSVLYQFPSLSRVTKHKLCAMSFLPFENLSIIFVSLRLIQLVRTSGAECVSIDRLREFKPERTVVTVTPLKYKMSHHCNLSAPNRSP